MPSQAPRHIKTIVGENLKAARESAGLTQRSLAVELGLDVGAISRWERGAVMPKHSNVVALGEVLGVDPVSFYADQEREAA